MTGRMIPERRVPLRMSEYRFLLTPRWITAAALVVVFGFACHFLAQWQLDRRAQAQTEIARVSTNYDAMPVEVTAALPSLEGYDPDLKWAQVMLSGQFLPQGEVLVRNRPCQQASGYQVVTPFETDAGTVVFVDRGCVPAGNAVNTAAPYEPAPEGQRTIVVHILPSEQLVRGREDTATSVGSINAENLATRLAVTAYTGAYGQLVDQGGNSAPYAASRPDPDEGPHLSYALQWYIFVLIAVVVYVWAARQEARRRREDAAVSSETTQSAASVQPVSGLSERYGESGRSGAARGTKRPEKRNVVSDADYEDGLIDSSRDR